MSEKEVLIASSFKKFKKFKLQVSLGEYLEKMAELGIEFITKKDKEYPERLREISDAPFALYVKRQKQIKIQEFAKVAIAVVGTRRPTVYGQEITQKFVRGLVKAGVTVVSGLALGMQLHIRLRLRLAEKQLGFWEAD
jgi:DNA processing protein